MDSTEEEFSSFTTKGRRTKRQRSLLAASASSTYRGPGYDGAVTATAVATAAACSDNSFGSSSASLSDDHDVMSEVTTEEEDMANCLILLAQGMEKKRSSISKPKININSNNSSHNNNNSTSTSTSNINTNTITNTNNIGVYECKTCNKTFPSFQALGGHRTSHKKIKPPTSTPFPSPDHHDEHREVVVDLDVMEFSNIKKIAVQSHHESNNNSKARVHECTICGSEFPSGQALGGHMRRHRAPVPTTTTAMTKVSPGHTEEAATVIDTGGPRNILCLDLNLPAPDEQEEVHEDDHHMETKFVHVLPRPAPLVGCHY